MGVIATSVEEQIIILKSRGMLFDNSEDKAKEVLLDIGYYRLGFYWNPFEKDDSHAFVEGTTFSNVLALYYLDVDLRNLLLKYLNRVEVNFKTALIYNASNKFKETPTWFIDPKVMNHDFIHSFGKYYNCDFKKNNSAIKKHHKKYLNDRYAPAWKTLEFFTFGTILKIYSSLKDENLKKEIANIYGILDIKKFENHLKTMITLRNACAHGAVIFDLKLAKGVANIPALNLNPTERHSLAASIKVLFFYLEKISENRKKELSEQIKKLLEKFENNSEIKILLEKKSGFIF